jgi:V/A-type H+-transporting ATPase subunit I
MERIAVVAPRPTLPQVLRLVGHAGCVELDAAPGSAAPGSEVASATAAHDGTTLDDVLAAATGPPQVAAVLGWAPAVRVGELNARLESLGGAVVPLSAPPARIPPTLLAQGAHGRSFDLLVETYATVPYADVDPTLVAGLAYAVMFGVMFGDAGHGLLLVAVALLLRAGHLPYARGPRVRQAWPFLAGGGVVSIVTGLLYGELFGPTGVVPVIWLDPLAEPVRLLIAAVGAGAVLLAGAYAIGVVNRIREGGWGYALYAPTGVAGALLFLGLGGAAAGAIVGAWLVAAGAVLALAALALSFIGLLAASTGGAAGVVQAVVELVDLVVRLGSNVVSFARLAAFGLTHAALTTLVWNATTSLWRPGPAAIAAVLVVVAGNLLILALESVVAGIQALRLEYYELFSRVFTTSGRPFRPWLLAAEGADSPAVRQEAP